MNQSPLNPNRSTSAADAPAGKPPSAGQTGRLPDSGISPQTNSQSHAITPPVATRFRHVTIIGMGLLGASLGMALRQRALADRVTGVGRPGSESLNVAMQQGAADDVTTDIHAAAADADLIVLATNISAFGTAMDVLATACPPECIITDVGSTKAEIMSLAQQRMPHRRFVGSHPMAGSEKSGPAFARADLYRGALCLIVPPEPPPTASTTASAIPAVGAAVDKVVAFWQSVQMRTCQVDAATHDQWVAVVSHVPHVLAALMVNLLADHPQARNAAAGGFFDTTRVASGNVDMWIDILMSNRAAIKSQLLQIAEHLDTLHAALDRQDAATVYQWLSSAKALRDQMLLDRGRL